MITLITGVPGAGKTLNTIRMVDKEHGETRPIYYRGIRDLKLPWTELDDDQSRNWFDLPEGSVIVIDECHQIWPMRSPSTKLPEGVSRMDTHRHGGYDIYLITQQPKRLDFQARGYVGRHLHYERAFGHEATRQLEWQECVDDPKDYHRRQEAQTSRIKFDKKYYEAYHSAEVHTFKKRVPKAAYFFGAAITAVLVFGGVFYNSVMARTENPPESTFDQGQNGVATFSPSQYAPINTTPDPATLADTPELAYAEQWLPRNPDMPWSAPMYDGVTEVKTFPRPQCMRSDLTLICHCFTQQATIMDVSEEMCHQIVDNGWFNPYRDETEPEPQQGGREASPPPPAREQSPERSGPRIVTIGKASLAAQQPTVHPVGTPPGVVPVIPGASVRN